MQRSLVAFLAVLTVAACGFVVAVPGALAAPQLPDLVADPPDGIELSVDASVADEPLLLLRFDGYVHNAGPGALDFRAERAAADEPMQLTQRVFEPGGVLYDDRPSDAELIYTDADGHHHWHLQRTARYSLAVDADPERIAAPAQKVGFCLMDSERMEPVGPRNPVYSDDLGRNFCEQGNPGALRVFEGISAGWRDLYDRDLAFQWVDASDVLPGSYRLRVDVDPDDAIEEANEVNAPAYAAQPTVIPGYNAKPLQATTTPGRAVALTLPVEAWQEEGGAALPAARLRIVDQPDHGTLSSTPGAGVVYTPDPGWRGVDTFSYTAANPSSPFPRNPAIATATVSVGDPPPTPTVTISGAPSSMVAGTSVRLEATVTDDVPAVSWTATAGAIDASGSYVAPAAPPAEGGATVTARSTAGATASVTIAIEAKPAPEPKPDPPLPDPPAPDPPAPDPPAGAPAPRPSRPALSAIRTMRMGRMLTANVRPNVAGRVRIAAFLRSRRLGACTAPVAAGQTFTCRLRLARGVPLRAPIRIVAGLRSGRTLTRRTRAAAPIPAMRMRASSSAGADATARAAATWDGSGRSLFCDVTPR